MSDVFLMYTFYSYCRIKLARDRVCTKDCKYYNTICINPEYPLKKFNMFCKEFGLRWS